MKKNSLITRAILLLMLLFATGLSALAQTPITTGKDILLYSTEFTDWDPKVGPTSNCDEGDITTGGGAGFRWGSRLTIDPTGNSCSNAGFLKMGTECPLLLRFPEFDFASGGVVEIWFCATTTNGRLMGVQGADAVGIEAPVPVPDGTRYDRVGPLDGGGNVIAPGMSAGTNTILDNSKVGVWIPGANTWGTRGGSTIYKVSYRLPAAGFTGKKRIELGGGSDYYHRDNTICAIKVYSSVGGTKYVASTNYAKAPANGYVMQGAVGGAENSGVKVPTSDYINVRGWNLGGADIKLSIEGTDAAKFSLNGAAPDGTITIPNATALASFDADMIQFTPSVKEGVASAVLKIEAVGGTGTCDPYYVSLSGITGVAGQKKILASEATIPFYTSLIAPVSQQFSFAGVDLTCPVTLSFSGTGSERFTVSETTVSAANANAGRTVTITYTGDIETIEHNVNLVLTSTCAGVVNSPLSIPLYAVTEDVTPEVRDVIFQVNPAGSAFLELSLAGPTYKFGASVNAKVYPETGWEITGWSNSGTKSDNRTFIVSKLTPSPIIVNLQKSGTGGGGGSADGFVAFTPTTVTGNGFTAVWTDPEDPTGLSGFDINIYDKAGNLLTTVGATAAERNKVIDLGAFLPATIDEESELLFWYEVVATGTVGPEVTAKAGTVRIDKTVDFNCGQ
ncbi:MAG: hypothetical protein LBR75_05865 [Prevotellaceae bacterium]|jgi:hypothetical protein|nr:hypothetical protein [Prevotellaceae bacterium]